MNSGGLTGQTTIGAVDWNPIVCLGSAFSIPGLKSIGILLLTGVGITAYVRFHDKFSSKDYDERGFTRSKYGTYGTASWMKDKELKEILEITPPSQADGIIFFFAGFALPSCFQADCRFIHIFVYDGIILFCSCISGVIDDSCNTGFVPYGSLLRIGDLAVGQLVRNCLQGSSVQIRIENLSDNFRFFS